MKENNKKGLRLALNIIEWTLLGLVVLILIFILIFASKKPGKESGGSLFGYETRLVLTDSMNGSKEFYEGKDYKIKNIEAGECIFLTDCDYSSTEKTNAFYADLKVGDVVTYYSANTYHVYITHRIIDIEEIAGNIIYEIKGDNGVAEYTSSEFITKDSGLIVGKVVGQSKFLGWVYTTLLNNKVAVYLIIIIPCVACIGYESYKIVKEVKSSKKEKIVQQSQAKDNEIEELKKKIKELENSASKEKKDE